MPTISTAPPRSAIPPRTAQASVRPKVPVRPAEVRKPGSERPGPVSELGRMSAIVVANPDGFVPTTNLHQALANGLPRGTRLVVLESEIADVFGAGAPRGSVRVPSKVDSPWTRDFAPTFVRNRDGKLEAVEFKYGYDAADGVAKELATKLGVPVRSSPLTVEGGNLLADEGRLFLTTRVLESNKPLSRAKVERELKAALHVEQVEWFEPLPAEPTGHIDMYAKLVAPKTMVISDTPHPEQKAIMDRAARRFEELGYKVLRVMNAVQPPKDPAVGWEPTKSYANALVVNGTAFVPQYLSALDRQLGAARARTIESRDRAALAAYASAGLKVVGVAAAELINFQGSVHCMTNTLPAELKPQALK